MYSFTFGTFDGLFVECDEPAILPNDLSYFDLRRKNRRAIPNDNLPNVVIRKIESEDDENAGDILLVALVYKAMEGVREGFIAFGSILVEDINYENLAIALRKCIALANQSSSFFANGHLLSRPAKKNGDAIDLRDLPISGNAAFFGQLRESLDGKDAVKRIARDAESLFKDLSSFELVVNENSGLGVSELNEYFARQVLEKEKLDRQRAQEIAKKENDEKLAKLSAEQKPKIRLVDKIAYIGGSLSLILLLIVGSYVIYNRYYVDAGFENSKDAPQRQTRSEQNQKKNFQNDDLKDVAKNESEHKEMAKSPVGCSYADRKNDLENRSFIVAGLNAIETPDSGVCTRLSVDARKFIGTEIKAYEKLLLAETDQAIFDIERLLPFEWRLVSFQDFFDKILEDGDELDPELQFVFGFSENTEQLFCSNSLFDEDSSDSDPFKPINFYYYTASNGAFSEYAMALTESYRKQFVTALFRLSYKFNSYVFDHPNISNSFENQLEAMERAKVIPLPEVSNRSAPYCVLTFSQKDEIYIDNQKDKLRLRPIPDLREAFKDFTFFLVLKSKGGGFYEFNVPENTPDCKRLPTYVLFSKSVDGVAKSQMAIIHVSTEGELALKLIPKENASPIGMPSIPAVEKYIEIINQDPSFIQARKQGQKDVCFSENKPKAE